MCHRSLAWFNNSGLKTRLKTSFRPKPRDQILFSKVIYRQRNIGYRRHIHAPVKRKHSAASFLPAHVLSILTVVELDAASRCIT